MLEQMSTSLYPLWEALSDLLNAWDMQAWWSNCSQPVLQNNQRTRAWIWKLTLITEKTRNILRKPTWRGRSLPTDWETEYLTDAARKSNLSLLHDIRCESVVCDVGFSADGRYVVVGLSRKLEVFDAEEGTIVRTLEVPNNSLEDDNYVRSVCLTPDSQLMVSGAEDKIVRVHGTDTWKHRHAFEGHEDYIYGVKASPNGQIISS